MERQIRKYRGKDIGKVRQVWKGVILAAPRRVCVSYVAKKNYLRYQRLTMRRKIFLLILAVAGGCAKGDDPEKFNSYNGYWTVTTPDAATIVTFRIGVDANNAPAIEAVTVRDHGTDYDSEPVDTDLIPMSATTIESITFRTTKFVIRLEGLTMNADFTEMYIAHSYFTFDGTIRNFLAMTATRP